MAQLAQLDDTCFDSFVQLENAPIGCLILRYARDTAAFSSMFSEDVARTRTDRYCPRFRVKNIFIFFSRGWRFAEFELGAIRAPA
jgi:hypothetical protein